MRENNLDGVKMTIYHNNGNHPAITCQPDYLGFMGIFLKGVHLGYPVGTPLEIEFQMDEDKIKGQRVTMIVDKTKANGTGLRLISFETGVITRWKNILGDILQRVKKKH